MTQTQIELIIFFMTIYAYIIVLKSPFNSLYDAINFLNKPKCTYVNYIPSAFHDLTAKYGSVIIPSKPKYVIVTAYL